LGAVRHRRRLVTNRKVLQQRLHDQLQALCPGLSAPAGHGRALAVEGPIVMPSWRGRPPPPAGRRRSGPYKLGRRAGSPRRPLGSGWTAGGGCCPHRVAAGFRAERLGRDLVRYQRLQADISAVEEQLTQLLAATAGQILTILPGVATVRAAAFAARSLPIARFPTPDHMCAATGLAPTTWQSASLHRRGRISRQGLLEHRDALMGIAWACPNTRQLPRA
jgi:transposase